MSAKPVYTAGMTTNPDQTPTDTAPVGDTSAKARYIAAAKALLLGQHFQPDTIRGEKATRHDLGIREGRIQTYIEVIHATPGEPEYDVDLATLRIMLLGQALTEHVTP